MNQRTWLSIVDAHFDGMRRVPYTRHIILDDCARRFKCAIDDGVPVAADGPERPGLRSLLDCLWRWQSISFWHRAKFFGVDLRSCTLVRATGCTSNARGFVHAPVDGQNSNRSSSNRVNQSVGFANEMIVVLQQRIAHISGSSRSRACERLARCRVRHRHQDHLQTRARASMISRLLLHARPLSSSHSLHPNPSHWLGRSQSSALEICHVAEGQSSARC